MFGFVVTRHVNSPATALLWKECYMRIRKYHPDSPIMLIDDNSNQELIDKEFDSNCTSTQFVTSEFPGRGELLAYYYYLSINPFERAIFLHDSAFLNSPLPTPVYELSGVNPLWSFTHHSDDVENEASINATRKQLTEFSGGDPSLLQLHKNTEKWFGCFGGMVIATYDAIQTMDRDGGFSRLLPLVTCRSDRMSFERTMGVLIANADNNNIIYGLLRDIHCYCKWGIVYANRHTTQHLPITKVWSGR